MDEIWGDEIPTLREITEQDWELIEHLAEISMRTGDIGQRNTMATAERARQLLEMPGAAILSLIVHLCYLRRDDLVDALEVADATNRLTDEIEARNRRSDLRLKRQEQGRRLGQHHGDRAEQDRRWREAQADPEGTIARLQALWAEQGGEQREQLRQIAEVLGINPMRRTDEALRAVINDRQLELVGLLNLPGPESSLQAEAEAWEPPGSTVMDALDRWRGRGSCDQDADWRRWFRHSSDFIHQQQAQAVALIASAVGATVAEVEAQAAAVEQQRAEQLAAVREAWTDADPLLADAEVAGSWEALAMASGVAPDRLIEVWQELAECR